MECKKHKWDAEERVPCPYCYQDKLKKRIEELEKEIIGIRCLKCPKCKELVWCEVTQ